MTLEHAILQFLGGAYAPNKFKTDRVCQRCNRGEDTHNLAEGAAGIALAALLQERHRMVGKQVGVILTGSNIFSALLGTILMDRTERQA